LMTGASPMGEVYWPFEPALGLMQPVSAKAIERAPSVRLGSPCSANFDRRVANTIGLLVAGSGRAPPVGSCAIRFRGAAEVEPVSATAVPPWPCAMGGGVPPVLRGAPRRPGGIASSPKPFGHPAIVLFRHARQENVKAVRR